MPAIEFTTNIPCKNMCPYCPQTQLLKKYGRQDQYMTFNTFKTCLSKIPKDTEIHFSGFSECFLNPECVNFIKYVADNNYTRIILYTTLMGLQYDQVDEIKDIQFETIGLHFPDNIGLMKCIVTDEYIEVVKKFLESFPQCQSRVCYGPLHHKLVPVLYNYHNGYLHSRANNLPNLPQNQRKSGKIGCGATGGKIPLDRLELLPNGNIVLCCMDYDLKHILGNLLNNSWEDLFKSKEYQLIIEGLDNDSLDILCRTCQEAVNL
jgi:hypothetical protein